MEVRRFDTHYLSQTKTHQTVTTPTCVVIEIPIKNEFTQVLYIHTSHGVCVCLRMQASLAQHQKEQSSSNCEHPVS